MNKDTWSLIDKMLSENPIMRALSIPENDEILAAESALNVRFDKDYSEFLERYGGAVVGSYPIFGLRPVEVMDDTLWSVITVTDHYRSMGIPELKEWYVISEDHSGNPVGLDRDNKVLIFDHDFGGIDVLASSFEDYLRKYCLKIDSPQ